VTFPPGRAALAPGSPGSPLSARPGGAAPRPAPRAGVKGVKVAALAGELARYACLRILP
jgi:hypothetical protein